MKGTFFQKPLEYGLEANGESWKQGDKLSGSLQIKNHGAEDVDYSSLGVTLALVDMKKFKAKDPKAFQIIDSIQASGENLDWSFDLSSDAPITEKSSSLYLLCGNKEAPFEGGHLQLNVLPQASLSSFLEIFENFFRFQVKGLKNKKGFIDVKMAAPSSKEFGAIDQLNLLMKMEGQEMLLKYTFKVKKLSYESTGVEAKAVKMEFEQTLGARQYKSFGDSPNQDGIMKALSEVLDQVKSSTTY